MHNCSESLKSEYFEHMANAIISIINVIMPTVFSITHLSLEDTFKSRWPLQRIASIL